MSKNNNNKFITVNLGQNYIAVIYNTENVNDIRIIRKPERNGASKRKHLAMSNL